MIALLRTGIFLIICLICFSCSLQKKRYSGGYHIEHTGIHKKNEIFKGSLTASMDRRTYVSDKENETWVDNCDTIFFRDEAQVKAKVIEVSNKEIKYKMCDAPDGPVYIAKTKDVSVISYSDGHRRSFSPVENVARSETKPIALPDSCVTIIRKNGTRIRARIYDLNDQEITYSYCRNGKPIEKLGTIFVSKILTDDGKNIMPGITMLKAGPRPHNLAVASLICGITTFFLVITCIPAIICGMMALKRIDANPDRYTGRGMAVTGIVIGIIYLVLLILVLLLIAFVFAGI